MASNIPPSILSKIGKNLHNQKNHPIEIIKKKIYEYFGDSFEKFDSLSPKVSIKSNFDSLLILESHPARAKTDTFYFDDENFCLRTHTSAHQKELLSSGHKRFLVTGPVARKDDINFSHFPIFNQMEGVCIMEDGQNAEEELKKILSGLIESLFPGCEYRYNSDYFPFTNPSFEVEIFYENSWLEVLGCGIVHETIMKNCGLENKKAYAFGLGLERLCMKLFNINDIRYFWSTDERFINQFTSGDIVEFIPYSNYPKIERDLSFWTPADFHHNNFYEIVRETGKDLIEEVFLVDEFVHPKTGRPSKCYRITYRSNDRTLINEEINEIQDKIKSISIERLNVEIR